MLLNKPGIYSLQFSEKTNLDRREYFVSYSIAKLRPAHITTIRLGNLRSSAMLRSVVWACVRRFGMFIGPPSRVKLSY